AGRNRDARENPRLPRRRLADRRLQDVAHDDLLNLLGLDARVLECAFDRDCAESRGRERGERAEEGADRRAGAAENDDFFHGDDFYHSAPWRAISRITSMTSSGRSSWKSWRASIFITFTFGIEAKSLS